MATKNQKPIFPMGLDAQDVSSLKGFNNTGNITHGPDAVMQVPVSDVTDTVDPSAVRYNADSDEFEGSYSDGWRALGGGGIRWEMASSPNNTYSPEVGRGYFIDSRTASPIVILPANPKRIGLSVSFADLFGSLSVHPMTIDGNGGNIYGAADQMVLHTDNAAFTLTWTGADQGWIVTSAVGIGSGRTYRRNVFETTLTEDKTHLDIGTVPEMVDIYINGARLPESGYKLVTTGIDFTNVVRSGSLVSVLEYKPMQLATDNTERIAEIEQSIDEFSQDDSDKLINVKQPFNGTVVRTQHDVNKQDITPTDFGADASGVSDSSDKFQTAEAAVDVLNIPMGTAYLLTSFRPKKNYFGMGKLVIQGIEVKNLSAKVNLNSGSIYQNPEDLVYKLGFPPSGDSNGNLNTVFSTGSHPELATGFNRSTAFGSQNFTKPVSIDRSEAFGNGALMFMRYGERNTMVGSIAGQWLGTNDPRGDGHELWSNAGGYIPGQTGWDYGGLETANPGIGAKIAAFTSYATTTADCSRNVGVGRDAFNGSIKLLNCTAVGYRASASLINGSNNAAFGTDANRSGIFTTNSTWIGVYAGNSWQEGTRNTVLGYNAGSAAVTGDYNTLLGSYAGYSFNKLNSCIFIGHGAGNSIYTENTNPSNILAIGNDVSGVSSPLISGNMAAPKVGINILPSKISATFHVRTNDQTTSPVSPSGSADELILENSSNTGMTIRSGDTGLGSVIFSSPTSASVAGLVYNHSTSTLTLRSAAADRWKIDSASISPLADNAYSVGLPALRPSQIYAGTATINTSDERLKTRLEIEQAEKDAALEIKGNIWKYQFNSANETKQDGGRYHFGVGAQTVGEILKKHGLDPDKYSFYCYDEWEDQYESVYDTKSETREVTTTKRDPATGEDVTETTIVEYQEEYNTGEKRLVVTAGNRYGIRYEELLCFIMAAL